MEGSENEASEVLKAGLDLQGHRALVCLVTLAALWTADAVDARRLREQSAFHQAAILDQGAEAFASLSLKHRHKVVSSAADRAVETLGPKLRSGVKLFLFNLICCCVVKKRCYAQRKRYLKVLRTQTYYDSSNTTTFVSIVAYLFFTASDNLITDNSTFHH